MEICKLCLKRRKLIKKSHVFPQLLYKGKFDEKNRLNLICSSDIFKKKFIQSGIYQSNLLCDECESKLSGIERYAYNNLFSFLSQKENLQKMDNNSKFIHEPFRIQCLNIDYNSFKLFLESLLWRASVSNHPFFKNLKIEQCHEEELRISLDNSKVLAPDKFPCVVITHCKSDVCIDDFFHVNTFKKGLVHFHIGSFIFLYYVSKEPCKESLDCAIKEENKMNIVKIPIEKWHNLINDANKNIIKSYKNRTK